MKFQLSTFIRQVRTTSPADLLTRFGQWWIAEFVGLFPPRMAEWLIGKGRSRLIVSLEPDRVRMEIQDSAGHARARDEVDRTSYSPNSIEQFLARHALRRADLDLAIRLGRDRIFQRRFLLPVEAKSSIEEVATQDLTRKTPFKLADIYHDLSASVASTGKIEVVQWVARRSIADEAIAGLRLAPTEVAYLTADSAAGETSAPLIRLSRGVPGGASWLRSGWIALVGVGFALAVTLVGGKLWRQQLALDDIERRLAEVRPTAQQVGTLLGDWQRTRAIVSRARMRKRDDFRFLDAWQEATRVLPHDTWLIELRLVEASGQRDEQVVMTGFSTAAARLVGLIDASPMFSDASLTAPISHDNLEERERFSIQATLRGRTSNRGSR